MPNRVPAFTLWDGFGPCVIYPVSCHVSGRNWEDKEILVPLKSWDKGTRCFGFVGNGGVTWPEYIPSPKVEKSLQKAVEDCRIWDKRMNRLYELRQDLGWLEEDLRHMLKDYDFSL